MYLHELFKFLLFRHDSVSYLLHNMCSNAIRLYAHDNITLYHGKYSMINKIYRYIIIFTKKQKIIDLSKVNINIHDDRNTKAKVNIVRRFKSP